MVLQDQKILIEESLSIARKNLSDILRKNDSLNEELKTAKNNLELIKPNPLCDISCMLSCSNEGKARLEAAEKDAARWKAFEQCGEKLLFKENFADKSRSYWHFNTKDSLQYIYKSPAEAVDAFIEWNMPKGKVNDT